MEEKEQLVRASHELLGQVDNQLPFDPNDPKVKELEEWECSVSRSVIVEVVIDSNLIYPSFLDATMEDFQLIAYFVYFGFGILAYIVDMEAI